VTYEVVVAAPNPEHKLIPGLTANLTIYVMREKDVLLLPTKAFTFEPTASDDKKLPQPQGDASNLTLEKNQKCIWVVNGDRLIPTVVTTGVTNGIKTEVISGIADGTEVAVDYSTAPSGAPSNAEQSPFAPQRPGRNNKK
ncbi:MAG: efflux RND transporter periplasmic adaptor subunit, partial [Muribaculum sp.]|nr:efflux RND transporter periplasmic adaptor subunit [Muribaculum sp.]